MEQSCSSPVRRTWGLDPSCVAALHRWCVVAHCRALAGLGQSLLLTGMEMSQMLSLESLKLTLWVVVWFVGWFFFFLLALIVGKHSFTRRK